MLLFSHWVSFVSQNDIWMPSSQAECARINIRKYIHTCMYVHLHLLCEYVLHTCMTPYAARGTNDMHTYIGTS